MRSLSRVVWSEGMHLAQHHFQAQARYFEDSTAFALASLFPGAYGLAACELNEGALLNGTVALVHARGIMPDGLAFQFPDEPPPEPLEIKELFSPTQDSHVVLLAIPPYRPTHGNCALDGDGSDLRYRADKRSVPDETTGQDAAPVLVARKNFRLILDDAADEELVTLPLARVRRDGAGHFAYDPDFVPPCVRVGASQRLMQLLGRLVDILDTRAEALRGERSAGRDLGSAYSASELASFWLSHAIHSALPALRHHLRTRSSHPEQVYLDLARLAGALCTFSLSSHPGELPAYDHGNPESCFAGLERHIREHLELIVPTRRVTLPVKETDRFFYHAAVTDPRCLGDSRWFLGIRSSMSGPEVAARVPRLVKMCSAKYIARLVQEASHRGLPLEHVPSPPSAIAPRPGTQYFAIRKTDPCWQSVVDTTQLGVYVPAAIPDAELEICVVPER